MASGVKVGVNSTTIQNKKDKIINGFDIFLFGMVIITQKPEAFTSVCVSCIWEKSDGIFWDANGANLTVANTAKVLTILRKSRE